MNRFDEIDILPLETRAERAARERAEAWQRRVVEVNDDPLGRSVWAKREQQRREDKLGWWLTGGLLVVAVVYFVAVARLGTW
jgi:hypothetical protein